MPTQLSADLDAEIIRTLSRISSGIGISALVESLAVIISRRSLQRRLARLVKTGRVTTTGHARSRRYVVPSQTSVAATRLTTATPNIQLSYEANIAVSPEHEEIRAYLRQPFQQRQPVNYQQDFLDKYRPNETTYLPEPLRRQLLAMGRLTGAGSLPGGDTMRRLLTDICWSSSRLEGNSYRHSEAERLIEWGRAAEGKDSVETQMILNHKAAMELLIEEAGSFSLTPWSILNLHAILSDGLLTDSHACGRIRTQPAAISGSVYLPIALPQRLEELFRLMLAKADAISDPFEQAFFIMVHLPYLHPFEAVNRRVSRLCANIPLIKNNLCLLSFIDVPHQAYVEAHQAVYELQRIELLSNVFVWAYERSCQQYVVTKSSRISPDQFRLRYREELNKTVGIMVRELRTATPEAVTQVIPTTVDPDDRKHFCGLVLRELEGLYVGNIARFRLRPSEFAEWWETMRVPS